MLFQSFKNQNLAKRCSKRGLLKFFGPILGFYTKNSPQNSWSSHVMITVWNQKSRNVRTPVYVIEASLTFLHSKSYWTRLFSKFSSTYMSNSDIPVPRKCLLIHFLTFINIYNWSINWSQHCCPLMVRCFTHVKKLWISLISNS